MADHKIDQLSLSFIWTRTFFNLLQSQAASYYPNGYGFLTRISKYKEKFNSLRSVAHDANGLSLPWKKKNANWFWKHYFREKHPWDVAANTAWSSLVPFRKQVSASISTPWLATKRAVSLEGFFYVHGVAIVITVRIRDSISLKEVVQRALHTRFVGSYEVEWSDGSKACYSLTALADHLLDSFCEDALGSGEDKGNGFSGDPFSIATVVKGGSDFRNQPVEQGCEIHKALESLTTWNEVRSSINLPALKDRKLHIKGQWDNHCLYSNQQGRVVWFPEYFTSSADGAAKYALGWYNRNLVLASLQVSSLGAFLKHTADQLKTGAGITNNHKCQARRAIQVLDQLGEGKNTYRTWSTRAQIEQNGFLEAVDYLKTVL